MYGVLLIFFLYHGKSKYHKTLDTCHVPNTNDKCRDFCGTKVHAFFQTLLPRLKDMKNVMESVITVLWKCSLNENCREVMEKHGIARVLLRLLTYEYNERVVGYAIATLSELWNCESLQPLLKQEALPKYLEMLDSSMHSLVLTHVCAALATASERPDCMKTIDEANGFRKVFTLLPSLDVDEFDKYDDVYKPETTIAAAECLARMIENTQVNAD